jgi:hypothetical protein
MEGEEDYPRVWAVGHPFKEIFQTKYDISQTLVFAALHRCTFVRRKR